VYRTPIWGELAEKIVAAGGEKRMPKLQYYYSARRSYHMIDMKAPAGNIPEWHSRSYEPIYGNSAHT